MFNYRCYLPVEQFQSRRKAYLFPTDVCIPNSPIIEYGRHILSKPIICSILYIVYRLWIPAGVYPAPRCGAGMTKGRFEEALRSGLYHAFSIKIQRCRMGRFSCPCGSFTNQKFLSAWANELPILHTTYYIPNSLVFYGWPAIIWSSYRSPAIHVYCGDYVFFEIFPWDVTTIS